jgi:hypothetical protein
MEDQEKNQVTKVREAQRLLQRLKRWALFGTVVGIFNVCFNMWMGQYVMCVLHAVLLLFIACMLDQSQEYHRLFRAYLQHYEVPPSNGDSTG